ncbi:MAG: glucosyltransferase domain-containing protein [Azoarcus sp.]|nr:glucosyltransferase domain-containing protein [Azoarcus sp.]
MPVFLFGIFISIGYLILLSALGVARPNLLHYVTFPLFAAFPTWMSLVAFSSNIAASGLAMLFACAGACAYSLVLARDGNGMSTREWMALACLCVFCAAGIGIYQTYLFVVVNLALGVLLVRIQRSPIGLVSIAINVALLLGALIVAIVLYKTLDLVSLRIVGVDRSGYVGQFLDIGRFLSDPMGMFDIALSALKRTYGGDSAYYGVQVQGFQWLMVAGAFGLLLGSGPYRLGERLIVAGIAAFITFSPFVMHLFSGGMPLRTLVAVPAVVWLFALFGLTCGRRWIEGATVLALTFSLFGLLHSSSMMQAADTYRQINDRTLAADIYRRIAEVNPDFDREQQYVVDIHGAKSFDSMYPRVWSSTWGYSFFEWDGGNPYFRMLPHMRALGYANLTLAAPEQRQENLAHFKGMPTWPAVGSVQLVNGVTLIKLGNTPGYPFNVR